MVCTAAVASLAFGVYAATPVFRHRFDSAKDDSGRHTGQAMSGAVLTKIGNEGIVDLGTAGGWFDFGTSLGDIIRNHSPSRHRDSPHPPRRPSVCCGSYLPPT